MKTETKIVYIVHYIDESLDLNDWFLTDNPDDVKGREHEIATFEELKFEFPLDGEGVIFRGILQVKEGLAQWKDMIEDAEIVGGNYELVEVTV